jgi:hypothetical protein
VTSAGLPSCRLAVSRGTKVSFIATLIFGDELRVEVNASGAVLYCTVQYLVKLGRYLGGGLISTLRAVTYGDDTLVSIRNTSVYACLHVCLYVGSLQVFSAHV